VLLQNSMKKFLLYFCFLSAIHSALKSQNVNDILNSLNDTAIIPRDQAPLSAAPIMAKKWNQISTKHFNLNFGLAFLYDYNVLNQDDDNIEQVGVVSDKGEFRGQRFVASGNLLFFKHPWRYMISANYNGLDAPQGSKGFSFIDWNFEIPFGKKGGWITIGKQKEGVGHEYVAPGTQLLFTERGSGVPMFVRQRNIGIRYSNSIMDKRATYTVGFFNNYWETGNSFSDNGSQITFRATGLPQYTSDADLMHFGFGYRYSDATKGKLSYKAKPEVNTAPSFINTGSFDASASNLLMFEFIKVNGPFSVIGEFMNNIISTPGQDNPTFRYLTAGGSWFITGENRKYNKNNGNLGKLIPKKIFSFKKDSKGPGAFELGARYTSSDLNQGGFEGGVFNRWTGAFSWYPNAHFRVSVNYGNGKLKTDGQSGRTDFWQFRTQFEL
jgi:phosphate-selective porin OprO and OprP